MGGISSDKVSFSSGRTTERLSSTGNAKLIGSATILELIDGNNDPNFYHRAQHLAATKAFFVFRIH